MTAPARTMFGGAPVVDALVFDLGGVLVDFAGAQGLAALVHPPMSAPALTERWARCPHSLAFGAGQMSEQAFGEAFVRDWAIDLAVDDFLDAYRSWVRGLLPGARELLAHLRPRYRLAALSNSNALHWHRLVDDFDLLPLFDVALSSHQIGVRKPAPEAFHAVLDALAVPPEAVLFFDDAQGNVNKARHLGMRACRVDGVAGVRRCLEAEHLW